MSSPSSSVSLNSSAGAVRSTVERHLRSIGLITTLDEAAPSGTPSLASPLAGMHRLCGFISLSRARSSSLQAAYASYVRAEKSWTESNLLHQQIEATLTDLLIQAEQERVAHGGGGLGAGSKSISHHHQHQQQQQDVLADAAMQWKLAHARQYLIMDGQQHTLQITKQQQQQSSQFKQGASEEKKEATLLGLNWTTLSGAFKPQSSSLPLHSHTTLTNLKPSHSLAQQNQTPSFTDPTASNLQRSFHALLVPALESSLSERVDELWNTFDPEGEERSRAEQEAAEDKAAATISKRGHIDPAFTTFSSSLATSSGSSSSQQQLPPLNSSDLGSLLLHRVARLHEDRERLLSIRRELSTADASYNSVMCDALHTSALILAQQKLEVASQELRVSLAWLKQKMAVISSKLQKMEKEVKRDTYVGVPVAQTPGYPPPADTRNIVPSLQVIHSALQQLKNTKLDEFRSKQRQVEQYQSMGSAFDQLALEFRALQKQIENKQWTMQELYTHSGGRSRRSMGR